MTQQTMNDPLFGPLIGEHKQTIQAMWRVLKAVESGDYDRIMDAVEALPQEVKDYAKGFENDILRANLELTSRNTLYKKLESAINELWTDDHGDQKYMVSKWQVLKTIKGVLEDDISRTES